jgi:uncharacterized membrane protein
MTMTQILLPLALLAGGLAAGALVLSALGGAPLLLALPVDSYIPVHKFLVTRFDPFMPTCLLTALVCDVGLVFAGPGTAIRTLAGACAVVYLSVVTVSVTKNVPINKWIEALDVENMPADWASVDPRKRWRDWNLVRTCLATLGLVGNVAMVGVLL